MKLFRVACLLFFSLATIFLGCSEKSPQSTSYDAGVQKELAELHSAVAGLSEEVKRLRNQRVDLERAAVSTDDQFPDEDFNFEVHSLADAKKTIADLGDSPSASDLSASLQLIDMWDVNPEEVDEFMAFKQYILKILRKRVLSEVEELHKKALLAKDGNQAAKHHAAAGQVIALFPLSDDKTVLDQARKLTTKQTNLATQIQVLRRQRYNLWAVGQIEKAINGYYENSRTFSPVGENAGLVKSCVEQLSMVDPALLEPSTLELYTYALNLTNQAIREGDKVTLAKGLANPKVKRKSLGDF